MAEIYMSHRDCEHPKTLPERQKCRRAHGLKRRQWPAVEPHAPGSKTCDLCRVRKPLEEFNRRTTVEGDGFQNRCRECGRDGNTRQKYNLTIEEYDAHREEAGQCQICNYVPDNLSELHLDHDHDTLVLRGFLCSSCNTQVMASVDSQLAEGIEFWDLDVSMSLTAIRSYLDNPLGGLANREWTYRTAPRGTK